MIKGQIIEGVLKELRVAASRNRTRPAEEDREEQDVIDHLEWLLRDAEPGADILTCADFIDLHFECCTQCHFFMFPFDMCKVVKLKSGEYAWICCALRSASKRGVGEVIPVKRSPPEQTAKYTGYKPFADFFGGKQVDDVK